METSVIIPCYNAEDTISAQLDALAGQQWSGNWELLVVDNRCTDSSMAIVSQYQNRIPNLRIVDASARQGQPYALNTGADAARGENLLFCDADDVVGDGYIAAMSQALAQHQFVGCGFEIKKLNPLWAQESHANLQQNSLSEYKYPPYLSHSGGGALGVKRALHQQFDGFDETLPILHDTDFCWRLQLAGVPLIFVTDTVVHVRYRTSPKELYRQSRDYAEYNVLLYKRYRSKGMPEITPQMSASKWTAAMRRVMRLRGREQRAQRAWQLGWCVGRLRGSLKHRVLAL